MNPAESYAELVRRSRDKMVLSSCLGLLVWDQEVCMRRAGVQHRSEQTALLAGLVETWLQTIGTISQPTTKP